MQTEDVSVMTDVSAQRVNSVVAILSARRYDSGLSSPSGGKSSGGSVKDPRGGDREAVGALEFNEIEEPARRKGVELVVPRCQRKRENRPAF